MSSQYRASLRDRPAWPSHYGTRRMRRNNLIGDLIAMDDRTKTTTRTHPIRRPAKDIFPPAAESSCLLLFLSPWLLITQQQASKPSGQRDNRLLPAAASGDIHRPRFEPRPCLNVYKQDLRCFVQQRSHHRVTATGYSPDPFAFTRLVQFRRQPEHRTDRNGCWLKLARQSAARCVIICHPFKAA